MAYPDPGQNWLGRAGQLQNSLTNQHAINAQDALSYQLAKMQAIGMADTVPHTVFSEDSMLKQLYEARTQIAAEITTREGKIRADYAESQKADRLAKRRVELKLELEKVEKEIAGG